MNEFRVTPNEADSANVGKVKALYSAFRAKDQESIRNLLAEEPVWDVSPGFPEGAVYRGLAEILGRFYPRLRARVHSLDASPENFVDGGDTVVVLGHYLVTAKKGDTPRQVRFAHVWGINEDGRIGGVWQVADSAQFPVP